LLALLPVLGLIQINAIARADRYMYFPLAGLCIMLAWEFEALRNRAPTLKFWVPASVMGGLAVLAFLSGRQIGFWHDSERLFRHALAVTRDNQVAYDNLGEHLWHRGQTAEAIDCFRKSLAIQRRFEPLNNLGLALAGQGGHNEAIALYEEALKF